jgi:PAS domain S-box-containing protein
MQRGHRFFTRILLPTLVAVLLFLAATFLLVIPTYRESLMEGKRETIRELTNTAWSVMQKLDLMVDTVFVLGEAQHEAALIIGDMRYGPEQKDYFWITDTIPVMVMHPYRPTMIGMDLSDYRDNQGKNFFVDIVNIVKEDGDGYIDYKWQWKDDSLTVVSKLSYVKAYEPWGWIVGTGIYIDDVNREIASLSRKVIWISVLATLMLGALIAYLARRSYIAELERQKAQERLRDSMERYKKLVESSTDGVMMMIENEIVYINPYLLQLFGYSEEDFDRHDPGFFEVLASFISEAGQGHDHESAEMHEQVTSEQKVIGRNGQVVNVVVNRSKFELEGKHGFIFSVKDISQQKDVVKELEQKIEKFRSIDNLQLSANLLLQPLSDHLLAAPRCDMDTPVSAAARLMGRAKADIILVMDKEGLVAGLITHSDISRRVVATGSDPSTPVSAVMSSPVISISEDDMVMDAFSLMLQHQVSYIVVRPKEGDKPSYISLLSMSELRRDTPEYLINAIRKAESVYEISDQLNRLPRLIQRLVETGTGAATSGKLISKVSDAITQKLIEDAIAELGAPPAPFVFLALGSEGRREQTLATDQDNAIIFGPVKPDEQAKCQTYFLELGSRVCHALSKAGCPLCKGGVMAMNKEWCMDLKEWQQAISSWIATPNPQELLKTSIFFDFRPVYGQTELSEELQHLVLKELKNKDVFFFNLAKSIIGLKPPAMDSSIMKQDSFDVKLPIMAITGIARLWALKYGVSLRNTSERLFALESAGAISASLREEFDQAFRYLTLLRLKNQLRQFEASETFSNKISPKHLSEMDVIMLKRVSATIGDHLTRLAMDFRIP